jgi:heme oxygenase
MMFLRQSQVAAVDVMHAQPCIEALRQGTRALHVRLDGLLTSSGAFDHVSGYGRYLVMMRRFCAEHAWLYRSDYPGLSDFFDESPLTSIERDLQDLDATTPFSRDAAEAADNGPADAWGRAYVLLGSHLGAKEILARLSRSEIPDPPLRFLNGCRHSARRWRGYVVALNARTWSVDQKVSMLQSARSGFNRAISIGHDTFDRKDRT